MESSARRSPWQFSLRESLISMALIAALLALYVTNRLYSPSAFVTTLDEKSMLAQVCSDLGLQIELGGMSVGGRNSSWSGGVRESSLILNGPDIDKFQYAVMPKLQERIACMLEDSGASVEGRGQGGAASFEKLQQFSFEYRFQGTRGRIRVYSLEQSEEQRRLLILVDEH